MDNKTMAILGLVLSIIMGPVGLVLSGTALDRMKRSGVTDGKGIAIAGFVIGIIEVVIILIAFALIGCAYGIYFKEGLGAST